MMMTRKMLLTAAVIVVGLGGRAPARGAEAPGAADVKPAKDLGQMQLFLERTAAGHARLLWQVARRWPVGAAGFMVQRRPPGGEVWTAVTPRPIRPAFDAERDWAASEPDAAEAARLQAKTRKILAGAKESEVPLAAAFLEMLKKKYDNNAFGGLWLGCCLDYDRALMLGFGCWDRQPVAGAAEYGVFLVREDGTVDDVPAAVRLLDPAHPPRVDPAGLELKFGLFNDNHGDTHSVSWQMTEAAHRAAGMIGFEVAQVTPDGAVKIVLKMMSGSPQKSGVLLWRYYELERKDLAKATYRLTPITPFGGRLAPMEFSFDREPLEAAEKAAAAQAAAAQAQQPRVSVAVPLPKPAKVANLKAVYRRDERAKKHCIDLTWDPPGAAPMPTGSYSVWAGPTAKPNFRWAAGPNGEQEIDGKLTSYTVVLSPGTVEGEDLNISIRAIGTNRADGELVRINVFIPRFKPPQPALRRYYENADGTITWKWEYLEGMRELAGFRLFRDGQLAADEKKLGPAVREWTAGEFAPGKKTTFQIQAVTTYGLVTPLSPIKSFTAPAKAPEAAAPKAER